VDPDETEGDSGSTDPHAWPDATAVVRGGRRDVVHLANVMTRDGSWSVVSEPGLSFDVLCASVRHGTVRQTTLGQVREAGGFLVRSPGSGAPPYHCDLVGLTVPDFDAILGPERRNPIPASGRWRGLNE
jgi:hypothetical protein